MCLAVNGLATSIIETAKLYSSDAKKKKSCAQKDNSNVNVVYIFIKEREFFYQ